MILNFLLKPHLGICVVIFALLLNFSHSLDYQYNNIFWSETFYFQNHGLMKNEILPVLYNYSLKCEVRFDVNYSKLNSEHEMLRFF